MLPHDDDDDDDDDDGKHCETCLHFETRDSYFFPIGVLFFTGANAGTLMFLLKDELLC